MNKRATNFILLFGSVTIISHNNLLKKRVQINNSYRTRTNKHKNIETILLLDVIETKPEYLSDLKIRESRVIITKLVETTLVFMV